MVKTSRVHKLFFLGALSILICFAVYFVWINSNHIGTVVTPNAQNISENLSKTTSTVTGLKDLQLTTKDLTQLKMSSNGTKCDADNQTSVCFYTWENSEIIIQLYQFTNLDDRNGSYQYNSLHYTGSKGLISENTYGDLSRFSVNSDDDYGAEFNDPQITYYHLWIAKNEYLIHITSKGVPSDKEQITKIADVIMAKFG